MSIFTTKHIAASALVLSSAVFLTSCTSYAWPGANNAVAQESTAPEEPEGMGGMAMKEMSMDDMSDEDVRTKCMAMHQEMKTKMSEGGMMSEGHEHMDGADGEGMMMSPDMKTMHEKCMAVMPEMQAKHDSCMAMKADGEGGMMSGEGMMSEEQMQAMHQNCMSMDEATSESTDQAEEAPHDHGQ